jgi:predicted AAA+ superfamily ATPase
LLKEFGKNYYEDFAYFNFEGNSILQNAFEKDLNTERIITELSIIRRKTILPQKTLVIFDEIQFCNSALTSLKYFCENAPEYHIAAAGSLLGIVLSKPLSFPVGKVDFVIQSGTDIVPVEVKSSGNVRAR